MSNDKQKLWGGRFNQPTDAFVEEFTASVSFDQRLFRQDIKASLAHARMLAKAGVISQTDAKAIAEGLAKIEKEIIAGEFEWSVAREDVHMNIEARLTELIGDAGKRLHTGRSRNDQVATDLRLYLRDEIDSIATELHRLMSGIVELAEKHSQTIMPGFTHLQIAQPIVFGHHLLAWYEMLFRDFQRLQDCRKRVNVLPLGSAALAGTSYPIDRDFVAKELGFDSVSNNSLDAVSDRDFAIEFCACAAMIMMHLSRQAEELVLWSSTQFNFIELPDRLCTGSSIMPQKKNPDVPELVRGKSGRAYGNLMSLLTLMKSQPLAYNKDNQEDKEPLFDSVDTLKGSLRAFADMVPNIIAKESNMLAAAKLGYATATDIADYLVKKGLPFRDAHEVVGKIVAVCVQKNSGLEQLTVQELKSFSAIIEADLMKVITVQGSVAQRNHIGGTAPQQVIHAIAAARKDLQNIR